MESLGTYIWMILFWASWLSSWFIIGSIRRDRDRWRRKAERFYEAIVEFQNAVPDYWQREWCDCATFYPMGDCPDDADDWCIYKHLYDAADKATREVR